VTIEILDASGALVRHLSSEPSTTNVPGAASLAGVGAARLTKNAGLNRAVWDYGYAGPWSPSVRQSGRNGPLAPPGRYTVRMSYGSTKDSRTLNILPDPRVERDGVTTDVLRDQLAFNLKVRDLVSDANDFVNTLSLAKKDASGEKRATIADLERALLTPAVRYSKPGLQSHVQYLYFETIGADQKVGNDARDRYGVLRTELDSLMSRFNRGSK
jgi:hypothetical protein